MKTIKQLSIGDNLYKVYTNYQAKEKPLFAKITVKSIFVSEKENLIINGRGSYSNEYSDFSFPVIKTNVDFVETTEGFFTTNFDKVVHGMKDCGMKFIKEYEAEIQESKNKIEKLRIAYWDYLNSNVNMPLKKHKL